jgi:hypothetical protein
MLSGSNYFTLVLAAIGSAAYINVLVIQFGLFFKKTKKKVEKKFKQKKEGTVALLGQISDFFILPSNQGLSAKSLV